MTIFYAFRAMFDEDPPAVVWIIIVPVLIVVFDWFFFPERSLTEIGVATVGLMALLGLWIWVRKRT